MRRSWSISVLSPSSFLPQAGRPLRAFAAGPASAASCLGPLLRQVLLLLPRGLAHPFQPGAQSSQGSLLTFQGGGPLSELLADVFLLRFLLGQLFANGAELGVPFVELDDLVLHFLGVATKLLQSLLAVALAVGQLLALLFQFGLRSGEATKSCLWRSWSCSSAARSAASLSSPPGTSWSGVSLPR